MHNVCFTASSRHSHLALALLLLLLLRLPCLLNQLLHSN
jgi:hypothetical protein